VADLLLDVDAARGPGALAETRERLRNWLTEAGLVDPALHEVLIAVGEATTNAVEHSGARSGEVGHPAVQIQAQLNPDAALLRVKITDRGRWRERPEGLGERPNRGRGRTLMAGLMDRVEVRTGPEGTCVELVKELLVMQPPFSEPPSLQLSRGPDGVLVVTGDIDWDGAPLLRRALESENAAAPQTIQVLDLRQVLYLDSAGLAVLWEHAHRLHLLLTDGTAVATVVRITGLDQAAAGAEFDPPS
jgi:anti-anti-sigma factor